MHRLKALFKEPVLHFLLLGYLLYNLQFYWGDDLHRWFNPETIHVTAQDQRELENQWFTETGQQPTQEEFQALVNRHIDEELLFREALRLRMHYGDPVIHLRLTQNIRFLDPDNLTQDADLLDQAYQLGMLESDLVVRRRLIQKMQHHVESSSQVTEAELMHHFESQKDTYQKPKRYRFTQLFFSNQPDAESAGAILSKAPETEGLGEPFLQAGFNGYLSQQEIERRLGTEIAAAIASAALNQWQGPVTSAYGSHLIRVTDIKETQTADYEQVRSRTVSELYAKRDYEGMRSFLTGLRSKYRIEIDNHPSGETL